ncbi:MAG: divalent-cation tolerance protein CutA [Candidatus Neomarinimicrobiota bacterium]
MRKNLQYLQITTTTDKREEAEQIAILLVEKYLAACVQIIGPITSVYRWHEKIENTTEWLCQIKTIPELYDSVEKEILAVHSYQLPEIIAVPIADGYLRYFDWLRDQLHSVI